MDKMKPEPNPFRRKRRANQSARYLNKREAAMHRGAFDRAGNQTNIRFDFTNRAENDDGQDEA